MSFIHNIVTFTIKQLYFAGIIIWRYNRDHTCVFHALTFMGPQGRCLNTRPVSRVLKHLPRDAASVNAMKQTCVIVILAYFTLFQPYSY